MMKSLIALLAAMAAILSVPAYAAPPSRAGIDHRTGGFAAPGRGLHGYGYGYGIIFLPRMYQPFWGDFCSNPPFGVAIDPLYYCYPGYYWDYGPPYYWTGYDMRTSYAPEAASYGPTEVACGSWKWPTKQRRYEWVQSACTTADPSDSQNPDGASQHQGPSQ
jgi:hypothetical protein